MTVTELRHAARQIWEAALQRANVSTCIHEAVRVDGDVLNIFGEPFPLKGRVLVIGAGKAGARMAASVEEILGDRIEAGLVVTKYGHALRTQRVEIVEAGHPIPDSAGVAAVERIRKLVSGLSANDTVLCLISGGGSALWPAPAEGITLEQKQEVTLLLLRAGATIRELNTVRKHLSAIKGGQLARWTAPARVLSLVISDVIGDPLDFIASGPTAPDTSSFADALAIVQKYGVDPGAAVMQRFRRGAHGEIGDTPKPGDPVFGNVRNIIIGNNRVLVDAAGAKAVELGFATLILGTEIEGEAKDVARFFVAVARECSAAGNPVNPPACILAAGETTVTVRGRGVGGRNQEMALAWAIATASRSPASPCCFASVASDGSDGPTNAAGGLVDPLTCSRAVELGLMPAKFLRENDSSNFLKMTGDLIVTGPTHTNLMDLQILLVG